MPRTKKKDYYETLGISRSASDKEIKAAYRKLARKYHPDVNSGDEQAEDRFKEVAEAFAVLSDPEKRAKFDRGGYEAFEPGFDPFSGFDPGQFDFGGGNLSDLFEIFGAGRGGRSRRSRPQKGRDLRLELRVPFELAVRGGTSEIVVPRGAVCDVCQGTAVEPGSSETNCPDCSGSGRTEQRRGPMRVSLTCPRCRGAGRLPGAACRACAGSGRLSGRDRVKVRIPPGVEDGAVLRLAGKGEPGPARGPAGDAFLTVRVAPHAEFRREGSDLFRDVTVGLTRAALGGRVEVPTLDGPATINLPPGTRSGQKFRLKGRGVPRGKKTGAGDLFAVIQIQPPQTLDARSRELLEEFERLNPTT